MDLLQQAANWLWFLCYLLGVLFVFFGLAAAVILAFSRAVATAMRLALLVVVIGVATATFVAVSFGFNYHSPQEEVGSAVMTIVLASVTLAVLSFGYFRALKLFVKREHPKISHPT